jgi:hypothetical protein
MEDACCRNRYSGRIEHKFAAGDDRGCNVSIRQTPVMQHTAIDEVGKITGSVAPLLARRDAILPP